MSNKIYDYLIIGAGWGGLTQAALHAKDGKKVCVLESYDRAGGYGHSFTKNGYSFCAEMQYFQGCQSGWKVHEFLKIIGLDKKIEFNSLNHDCFDKVVVPGANFDIPVGVDNYKQKLIEKFPKEKKKIIKYFRIMRLITEEVGVFHKVYTVKSIARVLMKNLGFLRYLSWTLQDFFDYLKLPQDLQAILAAQVGDVALGPKKVSMAAQSDIVIGYGNGAFFPKKGMDFFVSEIINYIKEQGGEIYLNSEVKDITTENNRAVAAITQDGRKYYAKRFISNMDPQKTFNVVKGEQLTPWFEQKLGYTYSRSCFSIFLGLDGLDLKKFGFGSWNIWHYPSQDIEGIIENSYSNHTYEKPMLFISTPSMHTDVGVLAPKGAHTMQIVTFADFNYFDSLYKKDRAKYKKEMSRLENELLDYIENNFVPNLKNYIKAKEVWSPVELHNRVATPAGNVYGMEPTSKNLIFHRVSQETPIKNLYLVGATTGYPGLLGVITGSLQLYNKLN